MEPLSNELASMSLLEIPPDDPEDQMEPVPLKKFRPSRDEQPTTRSDHFPVKPLEIKVSSTENEPYWTEVFSPSTTTTSASSPLSSSEEEDDQSDDQPTSPISIRWLFKPPLKSNSKRYFILQFFFKKKDCSCS
jgi:hypothetical protein